MVRVLNKEREQEVSNQDASPPHVHARTQPFGRARARVCVRARVRTYVDKEVAAGVGGNGGDELLHVAAAAVARPDRGALRALGAVACARTGRRARQAVRQTDSRVRRRTLGEEKLKSVADPERRRDNSNTHNSQPTAHTHARTRLHARTHTRAKNARVRPSLIPFASLRTHARTHAAHTHARTRPAASHHATHPWRRGR